VGGILGFSKAKPVEHQQQQQRQRQQPISEDPACLGPTSYHSTQSRRAANEEDSNSNPALDFRFPTKVPPGVTTATGSDDSGSRRGGGGGGECSDSLPSGPDSSRGARSLQPYPTRTRVHEIGSSTDVAA
ncbi:unnamed protein product, partial [Sphacelaria rigidula]